MGVHEGVKLSKQSGNQLSRSIQTYYAQELRGNPSSYNVITGNATACVVDEIYLPLSAWLDITLNFEQPAQCLANTKALPWQKHLDPAYEQ